MSTSRQPGARLVPLRVRTAQHPGLERRLLPGRERFGPTRAGPVMQAVRPLGIVAGHGVPQRLAPHPGQAGRLGPRQALERVGDREQAHRGTAVRLAPGEAAKVLAGQVLADGECGHSGGPLPTIPPAFHPVRNPHVGTSVPRHHTSKPRRDDHLPLMARLDRAISGRGAPQLVTAC